ncbi:MAG: ice-binding family protein [Actinomycetota bacterium]|nr:ice-binding family protein [Actinomycetota bacterium]
MTASSHRLVGVALGASLALALSFAATTSAAAPEGAVGLGAAGSYAVLAGSTVTNTGPSTVNGDVGVSPGSAVTGFPPGLVSNGTIHAADAEALAAKAALTTAFNDAAGRSSSAQITGNLGERTLIPGVYTGGALQLSGALTLDAQGDANALFVFQASSTLITASSSSVSLINGAGACNVYWQVGSSATLGTGSVMVGTVMALTSISAGTNAAIQGRLLAQTGAVTLDSNTFTRATCAESVATTTVGGGGGGTTTPGGGTTAVGNDTERALPSTGGVDGTSVFIALALAGVGGAMVLVTRRAARDVTS